MSAEPDFDAGLIEYAASITDCRCCSVCWENPCPACMAGGICDHICSCEDYEPDDLNDTDDWNFEP